ncbi:DNA polymerase II [Pseudoalteromonas sp. NBT06-2]|uniref:DNA polymerase II n=1 Tax=Pseudoalteromonas sp. NBT06-2 TaxID=2025950 RepID=UPI000BA71160|nr:DNA polymerase II [Pseudoalteromonas sp. NBT06-2]PAJ73377.1 DNA polymerase II [Pseudoalteromonas sp. NBT06-2]
MIQQTLQGFILSKQQYTLNGQICLCYWLSSEYGPLKVMITNEEAVFFIEQSNQESACRLLEEEKIIYKSKPLPLNTFKQKKAVGFYFSQLKHFYQARDIFSQHFITTFESDIRHCDRFLMERFICGSVWVKGIFTQKNGYTEVTQAKMKSLKDDAQYKPKLSMLSLDIECSGKGVLFSVGLYNEQCALVIMVGNAQDSDGIIWVKDETELLIELERQVTFYDPDVIIGWNVINFDFSLLVKRAEQLNISLKLGRAHNKVQLKQSKVGKLIVPGRVVLDGIDLMRNATYQFSSFSLANVSAEILGKSKLIDSDNRLEEIERQFVEDKIALAEYNLQDCILVWDIFKKENLLEFAIVRTQLTGLDLERMGGSVAAFVNLYLPLLHRSGYVAPNLGDSPVSFDSPGGYVMSSNPGLYENVIVLDFKSLYPSIIRTFLIDPMGLIAGLNEKNNDVGTSVSGFHDAKFSRTQHHLPDLIKDLWSARDQAKKDKDKMLSQAIKIIMNSFYGVLGSTGCRFYDPRLSSSITLRGHEIMQQTKLWIEKADYEVIYGDTDSTFIKLDDELTQNQCNEIGKQLANEINLKWHKKLKKEFHLLSHLEIEFETVYSPFFMPTIRGDIKGSKKRYVGQVRKQNADNKSEEKELIFKGMETVRSDWTLLARNFQSTLYRKVFDGEVVDEYIKTYVAKTLNGDFDHQLVYKKRLRQHLSEYVKNIPPHAQAALKVHTTHPDKVPTKGQWVEYVITINGPELKQFTTAIFNREHYVEKQIRPIAESILPYLNTNFDQILNGQASLF